SYGGLKDRHALTTQFFTVMRGPRRTLSQQGIEVEYLGQVERPFTSTDIRANAFRITLRALTPPQVAALSAALDEAGQAGLPMSVGLPELPVEQRPGPLAPPARAGDGPAADDHAPRPAAGAGAAGRGRQGGAGWPAHPPAFAARRLHGG